VPALDPQTAQLLGFLFEHHLHGLREGPYTAFGIAGAVLALAVEMVGGFFENFRARRTRLFAMYSNLPRATSAY